MTFESNLNYPIIDGIIIDLLALLSINYLCDPALCNGMKSCCASYDVCITEKDIIKIIPYFPQASIYAPQIKEDEGGFSNLFEENDDGLFSMETDENFQCKLAWKNEAGDVLCSLHTHALKNNLSFYDTKPKSCCLWPLAESDPEEKSLCIDSDCLLFPCVKEKPVQDFILNEELALIIENIYGLEFLAKINQQIDLLKKNN